MRGWRTVIKASQVCQSSILTKIPLEQSSLSRRKKTVKKTAARYRHPVPERSDLLDLLKSSGTPMPLEAIASALGLKGSRQQQQLAERLRKMVGAGQIIQNRRGAYCLLERIHSTLQILIRPPCACVSKTW